VQLSLMNIRKVEGKQMKPNKLVLFLGIMALFAGFCSTSARADLYFETANISTSMPHQQKSATTLKYYFNSSASRVEFGNGKVYILDYNAMKLFSLDPGAKTYTELNIGTLPGLPDPSCSGKQKVMDEAISAMMAIQVTPTNEMKTIEGYECRRYNVNLPMVNGEYWVSKDVKGYRELKAMGAKAASVADRNPMLRQFNIAGMVEKLDGFPVYTVNHVMGGTVESTLKNVEQRPLDPALFRVPKDYALKKSK
jgi:hypothetical protein